MTFRNFLAIPIFTNVFLYPIYNLVLLYSNVRRNIVHKIVLHYIIIFFSYLEFYFQPDDGYI